jgi:hypothetical protein
VLADNISCFVPISYYNQPMGVDRIVSVNFSCPNELQFREGAHVHYDNIWPKTLAAMSSTEHGQIVSILQCPSNAFLNVVD